MSPAVALSASQVDIGVCYVGVPVQRELVLSNLTMLPTAFGWEGYGGESRDESKGQLAVVMEPEQGLLPPGDNSLSLSMTGLDSWRRLFGHVCESKADAWSSRYELLCRAKT